MELNRKGEIGSPPPRGSRVFLMEDDWYFATREGPNIGPYDSRAEADSNLQNFIEFIQLAKPPVLKEFFRSLGAN